MNFKVRQLLIDQAVAMNPNDMQLRLAQAKIRSMSGMLQLIYHKWAYLAMMASVLLTQKHYC